MTKLLQITLALMMAWSGCFCQVACGLEFCEHQHHPGEASCGDESHHHHHDDDGEEPRGCEHPEPAERSLPDSPLILPAALSVIQEVAEVTWPPVSDALPSRAWASGASRAPDRKRAFEARLCRFLI